MNVIALIVQWEAGGSGITQSDCVGSRMLCRGAGYSSQFGNKYFTHICSGSEAGSYVRLIDFVHHSTLGLRVIENKKEKGFQTFGARRVSEPPARTARSHNQISLGQGRRIATSMTRHVGGNT